MHFVRAVCNAQCSDMGIARSKREILRYTASAVRLYGVVDDAERHSRARYLDHGDLQARALVAELVHAIGGLQTQQPRHFDVAPRFRHALFPHRVIGDGLAESDAGHQSLDHQLQGQFSGTQRAHAMMNPTWTEATLGDLEAAT